ncbi:hypothetical protein TNCV_350171 [Trichonephila clavipes]|nr:hypothetical protein TNCV_350171 [Trichonephila clavipes]
MLIKQDIAMRIKPLAKEKNDLLRQIGFLNFIILDTKLKEPNKSKSHFVKKRRQLREYKKDEPVTIKRTHFLLCFVFENGQNQKELNTRMVNFRPRKIPVCATDSLRSGCERKREGNDSKGREKTLRPQGEADAYQQSHIISL